MKRTTLLHAELSEVIARLGHGDLLVIGDAGLPIPDGPRRIDLAVTRDVPRFHEVLAAVLAEMQVESAVIADELPARNPAVHRELQRRLQGTPMASMPHEDFKAATRAARAVVRTTARAARVAALKSSCGMLAIGVPCSRRCSSRWTAGLRAGSSSAITADSTCISASTAASTSWNLGTSRVTARSMRRGPSGIGRPASPITSRSPWPRRAMTSDSSACSSVVRFMGS